MRIKGALASQNKVNWRKLLPGIVVSLVSLVIVFYFVDLDRFIAAIRLADYRYIILLVLVCVVWLLVRALVWRTLLREQAGYGQVFLTVNEGYLLNNFLPFRLGEIGRAYLLSKKARLGFLQVLSSILIERLLDVAFAVTVFLTTLPIVLQSGFGEQAAILTGVIVLLGLVCLFLLARNREWAMIRFDYLQTCLPGIQRVLKPQQLAAFFSGLDALRDTRRFLTTIGLMVINWGVALLQFFILLRAFSPDAKLLWAAFVLGVMSLGIAAPSSPGAIGVMEIAIVGALSAFKLDPSTSLAAALTAHFTNYLVTGILGLYALAHDGLSLTGLYRDVSQASASNEDGAG
jgi:glycosyltransferase 2 family protein